jgi:hypothetical protein
LHVVTRKCKTPPLKLALSSPKKIFWEHYIKSEDNNPAVNDEEQNQTSFIYIISRFSIFYTSSLVSKTRIDSLFFCKTIKKPCINMGFM